MRSIMQDLRYALRQLKNSPGFTFTAVSVLALGLGANIAVFTVLSGILLRPLPYAHPDRIVKVELSGAMPYYGMNYANMVQLRDAAGARVQFGTMFGGWRVSITGPGGRVQTTHEKTGPGVFNLLGVNPMLGRVFREDENQPGREREVLLSEDVWRRLYYSDPNIVGKTLPIRGDAYTIVGVMPRGFSFPFGETLEIWSPQPLTARNRSAMGDDGIITGDLYARLPEGMTVSELTADLSRAQAIIAREVPNSDIPSQVKIIGYHESLSRQARKPLLLLYIVVLGIWALACLNVTSLMLARAVSRTREQAVRSALGASRARLVQQSVIESLLLSGLGAGVGLFLGQMAIQLLSHQLEHQLSSLSSTIHVDWRVIVCLAALTLVTAVLMGIFPAVRASARNTRSSLNGITSTASAAQTRTREALVVTQLALTLVFLVGAGLFLRTINALRQVPLGFRQQNVLTGGVVLNHPGGQLEDLAQDKTNVVRNDYLPLLERLRAIPGVQVAALSSVLPMRSEFAVTIMATLDHVKTQQTGKTPRADGRLATPGLIDALGIPMLRGRFFSESDTGTSPVVVVINDAFAKKYLPGQDPIGHVLSLGKGRFGEMHIIGVVGDMKQEKLTDATKPEMYFALAQTEPGTPLYGIASAFIQVAIRSSVPADTLRAQFDKALHEVEPDATTTNVETIHEAVEDSFGSQALIAHLFETFAGLALMIASVGLYGLLSFAVAQRTREIGVRLALGAPQAGILALVLRRALMLVVIGIAGGTVMAWFASRLANSYMFGVKPHDAVTFTAVAFVLATASFFAAWLPARRAAAVDPIQALRSE